ncbi:unnamed protein product [Closterium sp. Yama58-4]|nr:unnamed protein product [Closterium sp. Yama58-4]
MVVGHNKCEDTAAAPFITVYGSDWRCRDVYTMYGLTLQQFSSMNPGVDCSALLPQGQMLSVRELLTPCSAFYHIQPNDTCSSVALFLVISEQYLRGLNPGVTCSSRLPAFRSLCVERDPSKAKVACSTKVPIPAVIDYQLFAAENGVSMVTSAGSTPGCRSAIPPATLMSFACLPFTDKHPSAAPLQPPATPLHLPRLSRFGKQYQPLGRTLL